jgi:hypothetical protein
MIRTGAKENRATDFPGAVFLCPLFSELSFV